MRAETLSLIDNLTDLISQTSEELAEIIERGGPGSGHHGHAGRPGKVGGSLPSGQVRDPSIPDDIRRMRFFHSTDSESGARKRIKSGVIRPGSEEQGRAFLAPVAGRAYATSDPEYALIYALGGNIAGSKLDVWLRKLIKKEGRYGYIFEIDTNSLNNIQPDEDSIGEALSNNTYDWLNSLGRRYLSENVYQKAMFGEYIYWAKAGKILVKEMYPKQKHQMIRDGAHIANQGELRIKNIWRIDKEKVAQFPHPKYRDDTPEERQARIDKIWELAEPVDIEAVKRGGPGSGHHDHAGRPGEVGGSLPSGEVDVIPAEFKREQAQLIDYAVKNWRESKRATKAAWMAPDGTIYDVSIEGHVHSAIDAFEDTGIWDAEQVKSSREISADHGQKEFVEMGFVRLTAPVGADVLGIQFASPGDLTRDQRDALAVEVLIALQRDWEVYAEPSDRRLELPSYYDEDDLRKILNIKTIERGGPGSGHFDHAGRPGEVGGSLPSGAQPGKGKPGLYISAHRDLAPAGTTSAEMNGKGIRQDSGAPIRGTVINIDDERIPEYVYHMTTALRKIMASGEISAVGAGGLGGDAQDRIVSMTIDEEIAKQLVDDTIMAVIISQEFLPSEPDYDYIEGEGWQAFDKETGEVMSQEKVTQWHRDLITRINELDKSVHEASDWKFKGGPINVYEDDSYIPQYGIHDWFTQYFINREGRTGLRNPVFFTDPEVLSKHDPSNIGYIVIPKQNLDTGALLTDFDLHMKKYGLREIRLYGDVPLDDAEFIKRHYGPGPHPGTGTPQSVHAGNGRGPATRYTKIEKYGGSWEPFTDFDTFDDVRSAIQDLESIETFERLYVFFNEMQAYIINGTRHGVTISDTEEIDIKMAEDRSLDVALLHNHPDGGPFSVQDIGWAIEMNAEEIWVIADEADYVMRLDPSLTRKEWAGMGLDSIRYTFLTRVARRLRDLELLGFGEPVEPDQNSPALIKAGVDTWASIANGWPEYFQYEVRHKQ